MKPRLDRLKKVLKALPRRETKRVKFDLRDFIAIDDCGTAACACGWYRLKHPRSRLGSYNRRNSAWGFILTEDIRRHFQVTYDDARRLFFWKRNRRHNSLAGTKSRIAAFIAAHEKGKR